MQDFGSGVIAMGGQMVDRPVALRAERLGLPKHRD